MISFFNHQDQVASSHSNGVPVEISNGTTGAAAGKDSLNYLLDSYYDTFLSVVAKERKPSPSTL